jgi:hypothetical protein
MFKVLGCYVINSSTETPRLCKMLDGVVRQMIKNRPLEDMKIHMEKIFPGIQNLLDRQDDLIPLTTFAPVEPLADRIEPLEFPFEKRLPSWKSSTQWRQIDETGLEGERGARELRSQGEAYRHYKCTIVQSCRTKYSIGTRTSKGGLMLQARRDGGGDLGRHRDDFFIVIITVACLRQKSQTIPAL